MVTSLVSHVSHMAMPLQLFMYTDIGHNAVMLTLVACTHSTQGVLQVATSVLARKTTNAVTPALPNQGIAHAQLTYMETLSHTYSQPPSCSLAPLNTLPVPKPHTTMVSYKSPEHPPDLTSLQTQVSMIH